MRVLNLTLRHLITLEGIPPSSNSIYVGLHWSQRKKVVDTWHKAVFYACRGKEALIWPIALSITLSFGKGTKFHPVRTYDASNASFALKLVEDGLVLAKILKGDASEHVKLVLLSCQRSEDKISRTIIEFAEMK